MKFTSADAGRFAVCNMAKCYASILSNVPAPDNRLSAPGCAECYDKSFPRARVRAGTGRLRLSIPRPSIRVLVPEADNAHGLHGRETEVIQRPGHRLDAREELLFRDMESVHRCSRGCWLSRNRG